jgi:hypothetical protein
MAELTVAIAGSHHQKGAAAVLSRLRPGTSVTLKREADNPFDAFAIGIWRLGLKLGYVPKTQNIEIAWALDRGDPVAATFDGLQEAGKAVVTLSWS